jgi:hypothetical protein
MSAETSASELLLISWVFWLISNHNIWGPWLSTLTVHVPGQRNSPSNAGCNAMGAQVFFGCRASSTKMLLLEGRGTKAVQETCRHKKLRHHARKMVNQILQTTYG